MATHDPSESDEESIEDEGFTMPDDEKPKTGRELYEALVANGFIGAWKDRTDIGDTLEFARKLREREQAVPRVVRSKDGLNKEHIVATRRPSEITGQPIEGDSSTAPDDQRPKTGRELYKILTENGLIGMWKDRTDIGDTLEFVQELKGEGRERRREPPRKHTQE